MIHYFIIFYINKGNSFLEWNILYLHIKNENVECRTYKDRVIPCIPRGGKKVFASHPSKTDTSGNSVFPTFWGNMHVITRTSGIRETLYERWCGLIERGTVLRGGLIGL